MEPDLILPSSLEKIGEEAFVGGTFVYVELPEGLTSIGERAFADCQNLKKIYIPEATVQIATDAFEDVSGLTIYGKKGSYVEFYANNNHFKFIPAD